MDRSDEREYRRREIQNGKELEKYNVVAMWLVKEAMAYNTVKILLD